MFCGMLSSPARIFGPKLGPHHLTESSRPREESRVAARVGFESLDEQGKNVAFELDYLNRFIARLLPEEPEAQWALEPSSRLCPGTIPTSPETAPRQPGDRTRRVN